jgi:hypothetical protein
VHAVPDRIGPTPDAAATAQSGSEVDDRLRVLEVESVRRSAELRELAASVPAVMSRRAVLGAMIVDLRRAPGKRTVVRRVAAKIGRLPGEMIRKAFGP